MQTQLEEQALLVLERKILHSIFGYFLKDGGSAEEWTAKFDRSWEMSDSMGLSAKKLLGLEREFFFTNNSVICRHM